MTSAIRIHQDKQTQRAYTHFSRADWQQYRVDRPLQLSDREWQALQGHYEPVTRLELEEIYLPLARYIHLSVLAHQQTAIYDQFLGNQISHGRNRPYVIAVAGGVAVGKSTASRALRVLLSQWSDHPKIAWISLDDFLLPNSVLKQRQLMQQKGFPKTFDVAAIQRLIHAIYVGDSLLTTPVYSHYVYDIVPGQQREIAKSDIIIVEGVNALRELSASKERAWQADMRIYVDANEGLVADWYVERFMQFRCAAKNDPQAYFYQFHTLSDSEAQAVAKRVWLKTNLPNLQRFIAPTRDRAEVILNKSASHAVDSVLLANTN